MTTLVSGKKRAQLIQSELKETIEDHGIEPQFHIIYIGNNPVIDTYLAYKERYAERLGVRVHIHRFPPDIRQEEIDREIDTIVATNEPCIVQLPLPPQLNRQNILDRIPVSLDVDVLSSESRRQYQQGKLDILPPVTASIVDVLSYYDVSLEGKEIVVVGDGDLVGKPITIWFDLHGYTYTSIDNSNTDTERITALQKADIIISGAGVPGLIQPEDVRDGVIVIDAGTSEEDSIIKGDCNPRVAQKASLFTPVPGGIGPLTIAMLYRNVINRYTNNHD
jgi:methylenetetrahydrofolate dehydrogenase (NADP+)/methenyltetrahydrofolate cyclohydrolase